jgi:CO/xanthine dehydrogenase FAD-binding subunit
VSALPAGIVAGIGLESFIVDTLRYEAPTSIDEAIRLISADPGASVLAGGTDLLVQFRTGVKRPTAFIDVKRIPELMSVTADRAGLRIGAAASAAVLASNHDLLSRWPGLAEAAALIGSTQIQNRGSLGGNLCNGSPAADTPCSLIVSRAECLIAGPGGERSVPVERFNLSPGKTVLQPGEFLVAVHLPSPAPLTADAYLRLTPRSEMDIAVVGAAVSVTLDEEGVCVAARVALAAVAPTPILVPEAGEALVGTRLDDDALDRAAAAASAAARPIDDRRGTVAYRRHVAGVLVRRAVVRARQRIQGIQGAQGARGTDV